MIINERDLRHQSVVEAAHRMMTAARTAPRENIRTELVRYP